MFEFNMRQINSALPKGRLWEPLIDRLGMQIGGYYTRDFVAIRFCPNFTLPEPEFFTRYNGSIPFNRTDVHLFYRQWLV